MAIAFARARYIGRSSGGSAVRSAAYNERAAHTDERTGERYSFKHRDAPEHHEVLLPEGADARLAGAGVLWNAAEGAERRKDAQVAREIVLALPANKELGHEDRVELARSFAQAHFVAKGLAVQLDVHAPHAGDVESERANHHAHLLITTRRVEGEGLASKKARDLDPVVRQAGGRALVTEGEAWGMLWQQHQNEYFAAQGLSIRVDPTDAVAQEHVGPIRMRTPGAEANVRADEITAANQAAARDPGQVLEVLTRNNATFSETELDRHLAKHIHDEAEHLAIKAKVLGLDETLALYDPESGEAVGRYTTRTVCSQERSALSDADGVAQGRHRTLGAGAQAAALEGRSLRDEQRRAFDHAVAAGGLKLIEGRAGTGKSYTLSAVRAAHERAGYTVVGLAPTNAVAQDLKAEGFARAGTVHAELFGLKNGRVSWDRGTLLVVDEAAMLDSRVMGALLGEAKRAGAKLILSGDDRQLASIERGGLFPELRQRHGSAVLSEVTRQRVDWQRQAAVDLAEGRVEDAVRAFARHGALSWSETQEQARDKLVERWKVDTAADPAATRLVFAYTNKDVDALNASLRQVRRERGELGAEVRLETRHGEAEFAVGDRVQFTATLKAARIYNGNAGTIIGIDAERGVLRARLDGAQPSEGREVSWSAGEFSGFRHGYAGTIYKGQGKTLEHSYLYHSQHWRQASSYVALTRQRQSASIFAATETARDVRALARQMGRGEVRAASIAWATRDELPPEQRERTRVRVTEEAGEAVLPAATVASTATAARPAEARAGEGGWLIAPVTSAGERELDPARLAAVLAADPEVRREREALGRYLDGAYRDPAAVRVRLDELLGRDGHGSAARRLSADPGQLGELQGRVGLLAGRAARQERLRAGRVAEAIGPAVARLGAAEAKAVQRHRAGVEAQRRALATGVPKLSEKAEAALGTVASAKDEPTRAQAWRTLQADRALKAEVAGFMAAVQGRLGTEGVRSLMRGAPPAGEGLGPRERETLGKIGRVVQAVRGAEQAAFTPSLRAAQGMRLKS